jgi:hypothetical protein
MLHSNLSALKGLGIRSNSHHSNLRENGEADSAFLTDAIFVKVLSMMQLEHLIWNAGNARVTSRVLLLLDFYNYNI